MSGNKRTYDLVCSLGGNCAAAHNLLYRGMRHFSLPFDWLYILDDKPIYKLIDAFETDFAKFCLKENLIPLPEGINNAHNDMVQYYDTYSEYRFVNHFKKTIEDGGYEPVKQKIDRRISRLYKYINKYNKFLFILSTSFELNSKPLHELKKCLEKKWPGKIFEFEMIQFNCNDNTIYTEDCITIRKYKRALNSYDFDVTNFEWAFLDDIKLNNKPKQQTKLCSISLGKYKIKLLLENKKRIL